VTRIDNKKDIKRKKDSNNKVKEKKVEIVNDNKTKEKELYTSKEVIIVMIFSIGIGILMCFGGISIITGKNYLAVTKDLKKVVDTYYAIVDNYYGELDRDKLIDGAVEGMISSVGDTFTSYSDIDSTSSFDETINGSYEGIGCTVATLEDGTISVIDMFEDSPSYKAGLKVGDIILKVDGESYEGKNSNDISNYIKNSGKSKIVLTVKRDSEEKDISINLSKVEIPHVSGKVIEQDSKKIGYIKISLFASNSYKQFKNKLDELEKSNIDDLIIDVRDNSGGYLSSVTDICNLFLDKGKVIYQLEDSKGKVKKKDTTKEKRKYDIVVLINGGSASASEILASAIKESYGGDIVGTNSYGKGTVQQTKKLLDGSMIKYTTQKWLTPGIILPIPIIKPFIKFIINVSLYILQDLVYKNNDFYIYRQNSAPTKY
jgi:carboxyl-terminal processing protease